MNPSRRDVLIGGAASALMPLRIGGQPARSLDGGITVDPPAGASESPMTLVQQSATSDTVIINGTVNSNPSNTNYYFESAYSEDGGVTWNTLTEGKYYPFSEFVLRGFKPSQSLLFRARYTDPFTGANPSAWTQISVATVATDSRYRVQLLDPGDGRVPYTWTTADGIGSSKIIAKLSLWKDGVQITSGITWLGISAGKYQYGGNSVGPTLALDTSGNVSLDYTSAALAAHTGTTQYAVGYTVGGVTDFEYFLMWGFTSSPADLTLAQNIAGPITGGAARVIPVGFPAEWIIGDYSIPQYTTASIGNAEVFVNPGGAFFAEYAEGSNAYMRLIYRGGLPAGTYTVTFGGGCPAISTPAWTANIAYTTSGLVNVNVGGTNYWFAVTTPGTSGSSAPTWNATAGQTTPDGTGTLVWTCCGAGSGTNSLMPGRITTTVTIAPVSGTLTFNQNSVSNAICPASVVGQCNVTGITPTAYYLLGAGASSEYSHVLGVSNAGQVTTLPTISNGQNALPTTRGAGLHAGGGRIVLIAFDGTNVAWGIFPVFSSWATPSVGNDIFTLNALPWSSGMIVTAGDTISDSSGNVQLAVNSGTTAGAPPTFATTVGATVTDAGGITWKCNTLLGNFASLKSFQLKYVSDETAWLGGTPCPRAGALLRIYGGPYTDDQDSVTYQMYFPLLVQGMPTSGALPLFTCSGVNTLPSGKQQFASDFDMVIDGVAVSNLHGEPGTSDANQSAWRPPGGFGLLYVNRNHVFNCDNGWLAGYPWVVGGIANSKLERNGSASPQLPLEQAYFNIMAFAMVQNYIAIGANGSHALKSRARTFVASNARTFMGNEAAGAAGLDVCVGKTTFIDSLTTQHGPNFNITNFQIWMLEESQDIYYNANIHFGLVRAINDMNGTVSGVACLYNGQTVGGRGPAARIQVDTFDFCPTYPLAAVPPVTAGGTPSQFGMPTSGAGAYGVTIGTLTQYAQANRASLGWEDYSAPPLMNAALDNAIAAPRNSLVQTGQAASGWMNADVPPWQDIFFTPANSPAISTQDNFGDVIMISLSNAPPGTVLGQFALDPVNLFWYSLGAVSTGSLALPVGPNLMDAVYSPNGVAVPVAAPYLSAGSTVSLSCYNPGNASAVNGTLNTFPASNVSGNQALTVTGTTGTSWQQVTTTLPPNTSVYRGTNVIGGTSPSWVSVNSSGQLIMGSGASAGQTDTIQVACNYWATPGTVSTILRSTSYTSGQVGTDDNGNLQICVQSGTTAVSHPTWATGVGNLTTDGTVKWQCSVKSGFWLIKFYQLMVGP